MQRIYFDNNASTSLDSQVREAMQPFFEEQFGNPSSGHRFGEAAAHAMQVSRTERDAIKRRVSLLEPGSLDPDMLEERARLMLNYGHVDDIVILEDRKRRK